MQRLSTEEAVHIFEQNAKYFEQNQKKVFDKLSALESAIEQNLYQNRYALILEENYYEVVELSNNAKLYNADSFVYADTVSKSISFKKNENVFETFKWLFVKEANNSTSDEGIIGITPIMKYINKNLPDSQDLEKIEKFIFFGVGLGTHLLSIDEKIDAKAYFIIEDDLELFKLSLFCVPYYQLASKSNLYFSVFDTKEEFAIPALHFLQTHFYANHYIKYFHMLSHGEEKLKEFHLYVVSQSHNIFFYNDILVQYLTPLDYMKSGFNFLNILKSYHESSLGLKPVILIAAGPSLQKNIEWLRENQKKFIIIALSSTLRILENSSIQPDIVTHIDAGEGAYPHFEKLHSASFLQMPIYVISARTPRRIVDTLNKKNIFFFESGTSYKRELGNLSAPCVGSTTYLLSLALGVQEFYLLGLDLALDNKTGSTHSEGHEHVEKLDVSSSQEHEDVIHFKTTVIQTAGNFQPEVFTTPEYMLSIQSINEVSLGFKSQSQHIYNLNSGAKFSNTITQSVDAIDVKKFAEIDKEAVRLELSELFTNNSSSSITDNELLLLEHRIEHANKLKTIVQAQQNRVFATKSDFLDSLKRLFSEFTSDVSATGYDLSLVYHEYFKIIYSFIFNFFNTTDLTDEEVHANSINQLLCVQVLRIVDVYIDRLDKTQKAAVARD